MVIKSDVPLVLDFKTPLWTGGVNGNMDRLHETGLMGSIRWWFEALIRGLEGSACDPVKSPCPQNVNNNEKEYCDACKVFGATGLKRMFSLVATGDEMPPKGAQLRIKVFNNRGWYLPQGLVGPLHLCLFPARLDSELSLEEVWQLLTLTLLLQEKWGGLGAKTQQGYGIFKFKGGITSIDSEQCNSIFEKIKSRQKKRIVSSDDLPDISKFFFAKIRFNLSNDTNIEFLKKFTSSIESNAELNWYLNNSILPIGPIIRYHIRHLIREGIKYKNRHANAPARWHLMGVLNGRYHNEDYGKVSSYWLCKKCGQTWQKKPRKHEHRNQILKKYRCQECNNNLPNPKEMYRYASKIHISHAYKIENNKNGTSKYEFRIWGWIPDNILENVTRQDVIDIIKEWLGIKSSSETQKEFYPAKDGKLWQSMKNFEEYNPTILFLDKGKTEDSNAYIKRLISEDNDT